MWRKPIEEKYNLTSKLQKKLNIVSEAAKNLDKRLIILVGLL